MSKIRVYDLPTRLFHWTFAALFLIAYAIGSTIDDESFYFMYHMFTGLLLSGLVCFRLVWGVIGSKYARFSSFKFCIRSLIQYVMSFFGKASKPDLGHNVASSFSAIIMMGLVLGLGFTGIQMTLGKNHHFYEEIHEFLVNSMILVVLAHVLGVIIHTIRHKDKLATSMVTGYKQIETSEKGIAKKHVFAAIILVVYMFSLGLYLNRNFNSSAGTLTLFGTTLQLSENETGHETELNPAKNGLEKANDGDNDDEEEDDDD